MSWFNGKWNFESSKNANCRDYSGGLRRRFCAFWLKLEVKGVDRYGLVLSSDGEIAGEEFKHERQGFQDCVKIMRSVDHAQFM